MARQDFANFAYFSAGLLLWDGFAKLCRPLGAKIANFCGKPPLFPVTGLSMVKAVV